MHSANAPMWALWVLPRSFQTLFLLPPPSLWLSGSHAFLHECLSWRSLCTLLFDMLAFSKCQSLRSGPYHQQGNQASPESGRGSRTIG